jgi:cyclohexanecarboxyl-CoA dehydrogenase
MDFEFSVAQRELAERVRAFAGAGRRLRPGLFAELAREGLLALRVPAEYGGRAAGAVGTGIALEGLAAGDLTVCYPVLNAALVAGVLAATATGGQRARWLPPIARGEAILVCRTDSEAANIELSAEPAGDGWRLSGAETATILGEYATHALVFARTGKPRGVTTFYLALDDPRIERSPLRDPDGRSAGRATLTFNQVPVGPDEVVGAPGRGFVQVTRGLDYSRALIALMSVGAAGAALEEAFAHVRQRHAFGQPIGRFQGVSFPLVEHATFLRAARLLAYEALWRKDAGLDHRTEANMAKWWAPQAAVDAAHQALLTLAHLGWSDDRPLARRLRDVIGTELADGDANATKLVVARRLLGRDHAP